jgi:hypothetical protein
VKNLEAMELGTEALEIGTDSVRLFVARYLGLPFAPAEGTGLPARAVELLAATGRLDEAVLADLRARAVDTGAVAKTAVAAAAPEAAPEPAPASKVASSVTAPAAAAATPAAPEAAPAGGASAGTSATSDHAAADAASETRTVKGSTTFGNLEDWGVDPDALEEVLGGPPGAPGTTVRNWCVDKGIEFSTVRAAVQALVDAAAP